MWAPFNRLWWCYCGRLFMDYGYGDVCAAQEAGVGAAQEVGVGASMFTRELFMVPVGAVV